MTTETRIFGRAISFLGTHNATGGGHMWNRRCRSAAGLLGRFLVPLTAIVACHAGPRIRDGFEQGFPVTHFEPSGALDGNELFGNSVDVFAFGGSDCFKQGCRIIPAGDSGQVEQKVLTLDHPNIERCFDACLRANLTETPGGVAEAEQVSCQWYRGNKSCSVSSIGPVRCWNGTGYEGYHEHVHSADSDYFSFHHRSAENGGCPVRLRSELLLVGARMDGASPTLVDSGLATLYTRRSFSNETWEFVAFVTPEDANDLSQNDNYGAAVHIFNQHYILVSSNFDDTPGHANLHNTGSVFLFQVYYAANGSASSTIELQQIHSPSTIENEHFGSSIASDGRQWLAISSRGEAPYRGYVYLYQLYTGPNGTPQFQHSQTLSGNQTSSYSGYFGRSISISGKTMAVGADATDVGGKTNQGCVHVYELDTQNTWVYQQQITASDGEANDRFGYSLSLDNDKRLLVGSHHDVNENGGNNPGAAYYYVRNGSSSHPWIERQKIILDSASTDNYFGAAISHSSIGDMAAIGSTGDLSMNGSVYIYNFNRTLDQYTLLQSVTHFNSTNAIEHRFGSALKFSNNILAIGAERDDNLESGVVDAGAVDVFSFKPSKPTADMVKSIRVKNGYIEIEVIPLGSTFPHGDVTEYVAFTDGSGCEMQSNGQCWKRHFSASASTVEASDRRLLASLDGVSLETQQSMVEQNINYSIILNITGLMNGKPYRVTLAACAKRGCGMFTQFYGPFVPAQPPNQMPQPVATAGNGVISVVAPAPTWDGGGAIITYMAMLLPDGRHLENAVEAKFLFDRLVNGKAYTVHVYAQNWAGTSAISAASGTAVPAEVPGSPKVISVPVHDKGFIARFDAPAWDGGGSILYYVLVLYQQSKNATLPAVGTVIGNSSDASTTSIRVDNLKNFVVYNVTVRAVNWQGLGNYSDFYQVVPMPPPNTLLPGLSAGIIVLIVLLSLSFVGGTAFLARKLYIERAARKRRLKIAPLENNRKYFMD